VRYFDSQDFTLPLHRDRFPVGVPGKEWCSCTCMSKKWANLRNYIADRPIFCSRLEVRRISESDAQNRKAEAEMWSDASGMSFQIFQGASGANSIPWPWPRNATATKHRMRIYEQF
jgi:hypothetical protein